MLNIAQQIASELGVKEHQIAKTIELVDDGATIPFIARYRKEVTEGLDDVQLREFETRYIYLQDLEERKKTVLKSIEDQGKLTPELAEKITACLVKRDLEDLYLPFKPKRQTRATKAREAGLEPLAQALWTSLDVNLDIEQTIAQFPLVAEYATNYATTKDKLTGCLYIMVENFAETADLLKPLKEYLINNANIVAKVVEGKEEEAKQKYQDYFDHKEPLAKIKAHRFLALLRGRKAGLLNLEIDANPLELATNPAEDLIRKFALEQHPGLDFDTPTELNTWRNQVLTWVWKQKLVNTLETDLLAIRRELAEAESINLFADNLKSLLLASPASSQVIMGLDPGIRTGVKCAIIDATSKIVHTDTIYTYNDNVVAEAKKQILRLFEQYGVTLVSIGNGTGSRETTALVKEIIATNHLNSKVAVVVVNEAGASVYSASEEANKELPDLDVSIRGAVSIARRIQDPLAELVKIDPQSIGIGQYQHDLNNQELSRRLNVVIEDCVNYVGCDLNTASTKLLERVSGLRKNIAQNIVNYREEHGRFNSRKDLLKVPQLGAKTFEQCAGFLRVLEGTNLLDNSAVHPESYAIVEHMAQDLGVTVSELVGTKELVDQIKPTAYITDKIGLPTIEDILNELRKPGRDPRGEFEVIQFTDGVEELKDLEVGMILNGMVTNVTNFGAFVDVGVHHDGLVHISCLSPSYIASPADFVKPGEKVKVKVVEVDLERKRLSLTMILSDVPENARNDRKPRGTNADKANSSAKLEHPGTRKLRMKKAPEANATTETAPANTTARKPRPSKGNKADALAKAKFSREQQGKTSAKGKFPARDHKSVAPAPFNSAFAEAFAKAKKK